MSLWAWVLVALCAAGVLAALGSTLGVLIWASRVFKRLAAMRTNSIALSIESLGIQVARFNRLAPEAAALLRRASAAIETIRANLQPLRFEDARAALRNTGFDLRSLWETLR